MFFSFLIFKVTSILSQMSFFKRQPELFDTKKLGSSQGSGTNLAAAGLALGPPTAAAVSSLADDTDSVPENYPVESWVELAPSRASLCSSIEAVLVESASGGENSVNKDSRLSPVSLQSPHVEFESSLEQVKYRLVKDILPFADGTRPNDWLWDWTARSEGSVGPQKFSKHKNNGQVGSTLTTPPNSPEPESSEFDFKSKSSNRSARKKKAGHQSIFMRFDVIFGFVFSNLVTFFLGAAIGYCICRKVGWKGIEPTEELALAYYFN